MQEPQALPHGDAAIEEKVADLIDDARALANQPLPHPMERLEVELIGGLRSPQTSSSVRLHRFGDCLSVAEVILLSP